MLNIPTFIHVISERVFEMLSKLNYVAHRSSAYYWRYTGYIDRKMYKKFKNSNCLVLEHSKDVIIFAESLFGITSSYIESNTLRTEVDLTTRRRVTVLVIIFRTSSFVGDIQRFSDLAS